MLTIFYDQNCSICRNIKFSLDLIDFNRSFNFRAIQDDSIYEEFSNLNFWDCRKTIHLADDSGEIFSSEDAVIKILEEIALIQKASPLAKTYLGKKLVKAGYTALNNYRLRSQKNCEECRI